MNKMPRKRPPVKYRNAIQWPSWTDEVAYYPTDADQTANASLNTSWDDVGPAPDDAYWDDRAGEALALDQLTNGLRMF